MPLPLIPILGALATGAMSLWNNKQERDTALENTNRVNAGNMRLAEYQFDRNVDMWNLQNQYNNPQAQMERLKNAGLNPNLVYGSGTVTGNTTSNYPQYQKPEYVSNLRALQLPLMISQFQNMEMKQAQIDLLQEQKQATRQETINKGITSNILQHDQVIRGLQSRLFGESFNYQLSAKKLGNDLLSAKIGESQSSTALKKQGIDIGNLKMGNLKQELKNLKATENLIRQNIQKSAQESKWMFQRNQDRQEGIYDNDPWYVKMLKGIFSGNKSQKGLLNSIEDIYLPY